MKVLTAAQMRQVDQLTTQRYGIPGLLLMETAAARTVEEVEKRFAARDTSPILAVAGPGNNGGDAAAVARQLRALGAHVKLLLLGRVDNTRGDANSNFTIARTLATTQQPAFRFAEVENDDQLRREFASRDWGLYIDGVFGTGLTRSAEGLFAEAIQLLNRRPLGRPLIAIDIPSGITSDTPSLAGPAVQADLTVTFTAPKIATVLPPACWHCGELVVADIGSPVELIEESGSKLSLLTNRDARSWLGRSRRSSGANKGDAGKVLVIAGSRGKTGAASLTGEAALRAGAGLVTVAAPETSQTVLASLVPPELMTEPLAETVAGTVAREAADRALHLLEQRDVMAMGPGLSSSEESTRTFVRYVADHRSRPAVLDADALNSLAPWPADLKGSFELPIVITPHPGEMSRLIQKPVKHILDYRVETARDLATTRHLIVVLKGNRTVIADPGGEVFVNPTGNSGMATGGTGDVLTGIIAGFMAQSISDPLGATLAAVFLHGLAGDMAAARVGIRAMVASDVTSHLGEAFIEVGGEEERLER